MVCGPVQVGCRRGVSDGCAAPAAIRDLIALADRSVCVIDGAAIGEVRLLEGVPFVVGEGVGSAVTEPVTGLIAHQVVTVLLKSAVRPHTFLVWWPSASYVKLVECRLVLRILWTFYLFVHC